MIFLVFESLEQIKQNGHWSFLFQNDLNSTSGNFNGPTVTNQFVENLLCSQWSIFFSFQSKYPVFVICHCHFAKVFIWNKTRNQIGPRLLVIRKTKSGKNTIEVKFPFTNANLEQYTTKGIAYMQVQRVFVEHSLKESKQILGMDQFQTSKWLAWHHQVALNFLVSSFILKEKIFCFEDLPLLSARDLKEMLVFQLYKQMTHDQMIDRMFTRHLNRQTDINIAFSKSQIC